MAHYETTAKPFGALIKPVASFAVFCLCHVATSQFAFATIDNTATATANYGALKVISNSVTVQVPVAPGGGAAMTVIKEADDDTNVVAGQVITYTYVVRNTGTTILQNISLTDSHNASGPVPVPGGETISDDVGTANDSSDATLNDGIWTLLAPGDAIMLTATYTVTQSDLEALQ